MQHDIIHTHTMHECVLMRRRKYYFVNVLGGHKHKHIKAVLCAATLRNCNQVKINRQQQAFGYISCSVYIFSLLS